MNASPTESPARIWRLQSGAMMHVGLLTDGRLRWQKARVSGAGKLRPVFLHLVAAVGSGRVHVEVEADAPSPLIPFLEKAVANAAGIGGAPGILVIPRSLVSAELFDWCADHSIDLRFGTQQFKYEQKTSRHFEDYLFHSFMSVDHDIVRMSDLAALLSELVDAWNRDEYRAGSDRSTRTSEAWQAVERHFRGNPKIVAGEAFARREIIIDGIHIGTRESVGGRIFVNGYKQRYLPCGFELRFAVGELTFGAATYYAEQPETLNASSFYGYAGQASKPLREFDPSDLWFASDELPEELVRTDGRSRGHPPVAISLTDLLLNAGQRHVAAEAQAAILRCVALEWVARKQGKVTHGPMPDGVPGLREELCDAGFAIVSSRWVRPKKVDTWRAELLWRLTENGAVRVGQLSWRAEGGLSFRCDSPFAGRSYFGPSTIQDALASIAGRDLLADEFQRSLRSGPHSSH